MRAFFIAYFFITATLAAQSPLLLVLEKGANALGYYTFEGQRVGEVKVGQHTH